MTLRFHQSSTFTACGINVILGTASWVVDADRPVQWVVSIAFLPVVLLGLWVAGRLQLCKDYSTTQWRQTLRGVALAGWLISVSLGFGLAQMLGWIEPSLASRLAGAFFALIVTVEANRIPKVLMPLASTRYEPAAMQHLQRFAGWSLMLAGVLSLLVWIFVPLHLAVVVVPSIGVGAILAVVLHIVFRHVKNIRRCAQAQRSDPSSVAGAAAAAASSSMT